MSQPVCWVSMPVKRLERDLAFFPAVLRFRLLIVRSRRGGRGRPRRLGRGTSRLITAALGRAAVLPRFQVLEVIHHQNVLGALAAAVFVVPLFEDQVPFEEHLMPL